MRKLIYIGVLGFLIACASQEKFTENRKPNPVNAPVLASDSLEYEVVIFDPGFQSWFITRNNPATARSENYYKNWNQWYVSEWNRMFLEGSPLIENRIEYDTSEDYGFDVNYTLYHYFIYVEEELGIKIVNR